MQAHAPCARPQLRRAALTGPLRSRQGRFVGSRSLPEDAAPQEQPPAPSLPTTPTPAGSAQRTGDHAPREYRESRFDKWLREQEAASKAFQVEMWRDWRDHTVRSRLQLTAQRWAAPWATWAVNCLDSLEAVTLNPAGSVVPCSTEPNAGGVLCDHVGVPAGAAWLVANSDLQVCAGSGYCHGQGEAGRLI